MNLFVYLIPALFVVVFIVAAIRKVKVYDSFAEGVKGRSRSSCRCFRSSPQY